jgi:hypothetical protein
MAKTLNIEGAAGHAQAGADLPKFSCSSTHAQGPVHLRRRRARNACPTATASCARPTTTTSRVPDDIYVSPSQIRRFGLAPVTRSPARSARRRSARRTSRCSRSTASTASPPRSRATRSSSTTSRPSTRTRSTTRDRREEATRRASSTCSAPSARAALPHRVAAARRQDGADAAHRERDLHEPPRHRAHRAAHRRAPRRGHRHAAHGEGRGHQLDLRRAGHAPRAGRRDGDREGQAPRRAQA